MQRWWGRDVLFVLAGLGDLGNFSTRPVAFREGRKVFPDRHGPAISSCAIDDLCFCIPQSFQREPVRYHGGVLLDGVGDALILKKNREALQGRAKQAEGAQSATMMYSYKYTLARISDRHVRFVGKPPGGAEQRPLAAEPTERGAAAPP